ncbi:Abscission/NoCut checkpoint regulator [Lamellibrachia satsuma]|nr:Abscission/NoCut checkpoint regulator [Lamellibrachia satsuma]
MPGQCYSCATSFGVFKKEHGCKNCGFAFCKDCLREKVAVPRHNNQVHRVCTPCYKILTGKVQSDSGRVSPPKALQRQIAALDSGSTPQRAAPSHSMQTHQGMSPEDAAMAERLARLKADRLKNAKPVPSCQEMERRLAMLKTEGKPPPPTESQITAKLARLKDAGQQPVPTDAEMAAKLARLKGQNPDSASAKPKDTCQSARGTQQQEIDDLLAEINEEVDIDSRGTTDGWTNDLSQENNLNKSNSPRKPTDYVKNIPSDDHTGHPTSSGPDWQEVNQLISQVANELDLDTQRAVAGLQRNHQLTARLRTLQGQRGIGEELGGVSGQDDSNVTGCSDDEEDDEEATKRLIRQLLEERLLDQRVAAATGQSVSGSTTHTKCPSDDYTEAIQTSKREAPSVCNDLPWCCICNADATLLCCGCDSDLYCQRCFREVHDKFGMGDHKTKPYKTSPSPSSYDSDAENDDNW